ncbi:MAG TPA: transglycosylase SLT domain-containing protein [Acidobacteriaceae bacterium]|nr:transglycosylase SLT domain-containing protein [Acidobacteriaceae bacterium]
MNRSSFTIASACLLMLCGCAAQKTGRLAKPAVPATVPELGGQGMRGSASRAPTATSSSSFPQSAAPQQSAAQQSTAQQNDAILAASKQAYDSGVSLYQSAQYEKARADFDRAVDIFLTSGRDLKKDPALLDAFNRTVDKINALELDALQQSNGFSQQDQTPVSVANGVTFPVDPNLLARAQADLKVTQSDLPLVVNDYVASYINYFTNTKKGHNTIENSLTRGGRYRAIVEKTLASEGVPKDLIYLAIAESGFRPRAVNARSGAGGMWQFMPHGDYGLVRNGWVDERFDPEKSTRAYARYIKELHAQFGDWYLAMAAYDWGAGKVQRAVQRTGYADFWELYQRNVLPAETKNYVPIIVAAAIMAKNPSQYGLADIPIDPPLISDTVTTKSSIGLKLIADLAGTTPDEIQQLNPSLLRMVTPADMSYDLHLPPGTAAQFEQRIAAIPQEHRSSWRYHVATPEDTTASVAQLFHVKIKDLAAVNQLVPGDALHAGQALVVPVPPPAVMPQHMRYRVRRGDTIVTVADRFGVTTGQLRRWNALGKKRLRVGSLLYVSEPVRTRTRPTRRHIGSAASSKRRNPAGTKRKSSKRKTASTHGSSRSDLRHKARA